jgi:hypothetical protein
VFGIEKISACAQGATMTLAYKLPVLLVGHDVNISFDGLWNPASGTYELTGPNGTASCSAAGTSWECREVLNGIQIDIQGLTQQLQGVPAADAQGRLDVATQFGQDPIGVLQFEVQ